MSGSRFFMLGVDLKKTNFRLPCPLTPHRWSLYCLFMQGFCFVCGRDVGVPIGCVFCAFIFVFLPSFCRNYFEGDCSRNWQGRRVDVRVLSLKFVLIARGMANGNTRGVKRHLHSKGVFRRFERFSAKICVPLLYMSFFFRTFARNVGWFDCVSVLQTCNDHERKKAYNSRVY